MGASITVRRRLEWIDTDAAGYWHNATLWRFVEDAEARLHRRLGIIGTTFGRTPRRRIEAEFLAPLHFDREATVTLHVAAVGRTSATYEVDVREGDRPVASARVVVVWIDGAGAPAAWPEAVAAALRDGGGDDPDGGPATA